MNTFTNAVTNSVTKSKKDARTANGAVTRSTSGQVHLDLFAIIGSARNALTDAVKLFSKAYAEDKELALRIALWARDVRGGAGERAVFRTILADMVKNDPAVVEKLIPHVAEFGRWDDVIDVIPPSSFLFKRVATCLKKSIEKGDNLAAKWTPRKGAAAVALRDAWKMTPKQYRKYIVGHTNVVETLMCNKQWSAIEFDKLPSVASMRYQAAFAKNVPTLYEQYKAKLVKGEVKVNASTLFPHDLVANVQRGSGDSVVTNAQWNALPNYLEGRDGSVLVLADTSSSMSQKIGGTNATALQVSIAMGLYISERLEGAFKNLVLTFASDSDFHKVVGNTIQERVRNLAGSRWGGDTNFQSSFAAILRVAKENKVKAKDMPKTLIVLSDMEFNAADRKTNFGAAKKQFKDAGYEMPTIIFWNLAGRAGNNPVKFDTNGVAMVSGYSPAILQSVLTGESVDPMKVMFDAVGKERYDVAAKVVA